MGKAVNSGNFLIDLGCVCVCVFGFHLQKIGVLLLYFLFSCMKNQENLLKPLPVTYAACSKTAYVTVTLYTVNQSCVGINWIC